MLYSAMSKGFYDNDMHSDIPPDAVEISAEEYQALLDGQAAGQQIVADSAGRPALSDPPAPTPEERAEAARRARDAAIAACEWMVSRHRDQVDASVPTTLSPTQYAELLAYRQSLRDWPAEAGWPVVAMPTPPGWMQ